MDSVFVINPGHVVAEVVYVLWEEDIILAFSWAMAPWCMVKENVAWESCIRHDMVLGQSSINSQHCKRLDTLLVCELTGVPAVLRRKEVGLKQSVLKWALGILSLMEVWNKAVTPAFSVMR